MSRNTHYLVVDSDDRSVLAWFPWAYDGKVNALAAARRLARDTGHLITEGTWHTADRPNGWVIGEPVDLTD